MEKTRLGSDVVEERYGLVNVKILSQTSQYRESILVNQAGEVGAYSLVFFEKDECFSVAHKLITDGRPIGKTFRELGIPFERREFCSFFYNIPEKLRYITKWNAERCSVKGIEFFAGDPAKLYATIIEVYGPLVNLPEFETVFRRKIALRETLNTRFGCQ